MQSLDHDETRGTLMKTERSKSTGVFGMFLFVAALVAPVVVGADPVKTVEVDCAKGETIAAALDQGDERKPMVVVVRGVCSEHVTVDRNDVTLLADPVAGGTVTGPDPSRNTILVTSNRVVIDGLTVTGGRNGITASGTGGLTVRNCFVHTTGLRGIVYFQGASGTVDGCTVQNATQDGILISAANATVVNSVLSQNKAGGILVTNSASARIGTSTLAQPAGNTITANAASGISVQEGSSAIIGANTISANGTNPALGRFGIIVGDSAIDVIGGNTITGNHGAGVVVTSSNVRIRNSGFPVAMVNTISSNGASSPTNGGISASLGSTLQIEGATISQNTGPGIFAFLGTTLRLQNSTIAGNTSGANGFGVVLSVRSSGQLFASTIQNNTLDGIRLVFGSGLFIQSPVTTVSGNGGFGLQCTDGESSVVNTGLLSLSGNLAGGVSGTCTGF